MLINADQPSGQQSPTQTSKTPNLVIWKFQLKNFPTLADGRNAIINAFRHSTQILGLPAQGSFVDWPHTLLEVPQKYLITAGYGEGNDVINPDSLLGFGEIAYEHAPVVLLALWIVQKNLTSSGYPGAFKLVDQELNVSPIDRFQQLQPFFVQLGYDYNLASRQMDQLGLLPSVFKPEVKFNGNEDTFFF